MSSQQRDPTGFLGRIDNLLQVGANFGLVSNIFLPIVKLLGRFAPGGDLEAMIDGHIQDCAADMNIEKKQLQELSDVASAPPYEPFLAKLLRLDAAGQVDYDGVFDSTASNIVAGSDTTGITLSAMLWYIYHDAHILTTLRREVEGISNPVTWDEAQKMPYL